MNADLFEILIGTFSDGTPVEAVPRDYQIVFSIKDNLTRLFNTRLGSNYLMPDYGLPDFNDTHTSLPPYHKELGHAIIETMDEYEPRMKNVEVVEWAVTKNANLQCKIIGAIREKPCRFVLTLIGFGANAVEIWKKP